MFLCLALMGSLSAEAQAFKPRTVSSGDLPVQGELIFVASPDETFSAVKAVVEGLDWKLLYEGNEPPTKEYAYFSNSAAFSGKSYDRIAWDRSSEGEMPPKWYLQAKTKTTAMSFGAELFVTVFEHQPGQCRRDHCIEQSVAREESARNVPRRICQGAQRQDSLSHAGDR